MRCTHINIRSATFILLTFLANSIHVSQMSGNHMDLDDKDQNAKNLTGNDEPVHVGQNDVILPCIMDDVECSQLMSPCIECDFNYSCVYGETMNVTCRANAVTHCKGNFQFERTLICRYCYQTESWEHVCNMRTDCKSTAMPKSDYQTNCTVNDDILCLGHRTFNKNVQCNWTRGYRWTTALALSITLGGFGADRFYLGQWQEGIGKLFSFGGLGVWTLIDVILISLHYLGPADGSLYI